MNTITFSEIIKFKNGAVSGSFVEENGQPIQLKIENAVAPLGLSQFNNRSSMILNLEESHDISILLDVQAGVKDNDAWSSKYEFTPIIKSSEKYGKQLKVNVTDETKFFDSHCKPTTETLFKARSLVSVLIEINMVWFRGKQCGVSLKLLQAKHIKDIKSKLDLGLSDQCLI